MQHAFIYKILTESQWHGLQQAGQFVGAPVDLADGFLHFSTWAQAAETADRHFADQDVIILAKISVMTLPKDLVWEPSRGGALFPHLYGILPLASVAAHCAIRREDAGPDNLFPMPQHMAPDQ